MKTRMHSASLVYGITASAMLFSLHAGAEPSGRAHAAPVQLATGQFVTPLAVRGAVQQFLNPGLPAYPNFVAGEAVRSQLSPDGTTLAVLCAGQNSLYKPDGTVDVAASTQFIFLDDVAGAHKQAPALTQVIQQTNAHVGLVFSPTGRRCTQRAAKTMPFTLIPRAPRAGHCRAPSRSATSRAWG